MKPKEQEMNISVKVIKTITLKVNPLDTIKNLKKIIRKKELLSESEDDLQDLSFLNEKLKDERRLSDCNRLQPNSTLHLNVKKFDTIKISIHVPSQQKTLELNVYIRDKVKKIKSLIHEKEGMIANDAYSLYYKGKQIEDEKTLAYFKIEADSVLYMVFHPKDMFSVSVQMPGGKVLKSEVRAMHTVRDLKAILGSMLGYSVGQQTIVYETDKLEDWRTLSHYYIGLNSKLHMLAFTYQIFVKDWNGKLIVVNVQGDDKVSKVKSVVFNKLGVPADVYSLVYAGKSLENGRALESYDIEKDCTLFIVYLSSYGKCLVSMSWLFVI